MSRTNEINAIKTELRRLSRVLCCQNCIKLTGCTDGQIPAWDDATQTWICTDPVAAHDPVTLNADVPTQDSANLVGQELQLNPATDTTYGVMSPADKAKLDDLTGLERTITVVANFSALPAPAAVPNEFYFAEASQGTSWLPGSLGGTYYPAGLYYSTGAAWVTDISPWQATQADVDAGIITDQFVSPATLAAAAQWDTKNDAIQFEDEGVALGTPGTVTSIDFVGTGVVATRVLDEVTVTVGVGAGLLFGTDNQVPFTNATGTNFDYSANFTMSGTAFAVDNSNVVFNESGADVDFRIEGDTDPNLFFVDASTSRIGIGTNVPAGSFELWDPVNAHSIMLVSSSGRVQLKNNIGGGTVFLDFDSSAGTSQIFWASGNDLIFRQASLTTGGHITIGPAAYVSTTLAKEAVQWVDTYTVASGAGTYTAIAIDNTFNLTGTASGIQRGIHINPVLTSLTAATYRGIDIAYSNAAAYGIYQSGPLTRNVLQGVTYLSDEAGGNLPANEAATWDLGLNANGKIVRNTPSVDIDTNFFEDNLTQDANRTHTAAGFDTVINNIDSFVFDRGAGTLDNYFRLDSAGFRAHWESGTDLNAISVQTAGAQMESSDFFFDAIVKTTVVGVPRVDISVVDGATFATSSIVVDNTTGVFLNASNGIGGESRITYNVNGTIQLDSSSGIYILGDGAGANLPPTNATPDFILALEGSNGAIEKLTPAQLGTLLGVSADTNFLNDDLIQDADRTHDAAGFAVTIQDYNFWKWEDGYLVVDNVGDASSAVIKMYMDDDVDHVAGLELGNDNYDTRWGVYLDPALSGHPFVIARYTGSPGVVQDLPISITNTTGYVTMWNFLAVNQGSASPPTLPFEVHDRGASVSEFNVDVNTTVVYETQLTVTDLGFEISVNSAVRNIYFDINGDDRITINASDRITLEGFEANDVIPQVQIRNNSAANDNFILFDDGVADVADFSIGVDISEKRFVIAEGTNLSVPYISFDNDDDTIRTHRDITILADLNDTAGSPGTAGDVLSSLGNGSGVQWIAASVGFTDEAAQDAVGTILTDSSTIDFTYNDGVPSITAAIVAGSVGPTELAATAVTPGSYTGANITVDADGRITAATSGYTILAVGHPAESKINDVATEQDYTSIYTIPANYLTENKIIKITLVYQWTTGVSTATALHYLEIGGVKVASTGAQDYTNSITRSSSFTYLLHGTAAAGASVAVETGVSASIAVNINATNTVTQPVNLATNGTLTVVPGITYSATGSTETNVLRTYLVEALN